MCSMYIYTYIYIYMYVLEPLRVSKLGPTPQNENAVKHQPSPIYHTRPNSISYFLIYIFFYISNPQKVQ